MRNPCDGQVRSWSTTSQASLGATTVSFGIDGVDYEIDLTDERQLRDMMGPWIAAARVVGSPRRTHRHDLGNRFGGGPATTDILVPARGRMPAATVRAYDQHQQRVS